jgi:Leucine-rich repeat (LRR) protein
LIYLKKLDLGKNQITEIEGLGSLEYLTQLSLEDNQISSLEGLANLRNLMELYIGNNRLGNAKDLQLLSPHPKLIILDISGNALSRTPGLR